MCKMVRLVRQGMLLACLLLVLLSSPMKTSPPALAQANGDAQRVELLERIGGAVTDSLPLADGSVLVVQGSSLLRLRVSAQTQTMIARQELGRGLILDLDESPHFIFALTGEGLVVLSKESGQNMPAVLSFSPGGGQALDARDELVAVAARESGLRLLHVALDGTLSPLAELPLVGQALDVAFSPEGTRLHVAAGEAGVLSLDLSDPAAPFLIGALPHIAPAQALAPVGPLLAVGVDGQILLVPPPPGRGEVVGTYAPLHAGQRIAAQDDVLAVADAVDGLKIFWLAAPDRPVQVYGEVGDPAYDVLIEGSMAYVIGQSGLRILDLGNRYHPLEVGRLPLPGQPYGLTLTDDRAFVALGPEGVAVIDLQNMTAPRLGRLIPLSGVAHALLFDRGMVYVACSEAGLALIDASRHGDETLLTTLSLPGPALDIARYGKVLYLAAGEAGLVAMDVTYPALPMLAGILPPHTDHRFTSINISGKRAYLAEPHVDGEGAYFAVADVNRPWQMGRLARVEMPTEHIALNDVYLYALYNNQIAIYDVRATAEPTYHRTYTALGKIESLTALGSHLFATSASDGADLVVLGLDAPDRPIELDSVGTKGHTAHVQAVPGEVWVAAGLAGLQHYALSEGAALVLDGRYASFSQAAHLAQDEGRLLVGGQNDWALISLDDPFALGGGREKHSLLELVLDDDEVAIAAGEAGVLLYDAADPRHPALIGQNATRGPASGVALDANAVYASDAKGLSIYDRRYLQSVTHVDTPASAAGLAIRNNLAYLPLSDGSLAVIDLGHPTGGLQVRSSVPTRRPAALIPTGDGQTIYALADATLSRITIGDPDNLSVLERGYLPAPATDGFLMSPSPGALLAALEAEGALSFYDLSFLETNVIPRGWIDLVGSSLDGSTPLGEFTVDRLAMSENIVYVAYGEPGLGMLDLSAPGEPYFFYTDKTDALYIQDDVLFALGNTLTAWDVSHPALPRQISSLALAAPGSQIAPAPNGQLLLSLDNGLALAVWDGVMLRQIGHLFTSDAVDRALQLDSLAYLALHHGGLLIADLADSSQPVALFSYTAPSGQFVHDLLELDPQTLLVSWEGGIDALDLRGGKLVPPPRLLRTVQAGGSRALAIALSDDGQTGALTLGLDGITLLDLSDAQQPVIVGHAYTPGDGLSVALEQKTLYVADGACGLRVFDVSDPTSPQERGYWRGLYTSDVLVHPNEPGTVTVADANQVLVLRYDPAAPPVAPPLPRSPNPANGEGNVSLMPTLRWEPAPDGCHPLTYDVYFGPAGVPADRLPLEAQLTANTRLDLSNLDPLRTYQWRVDVTDHQGDRIQGPVWHFTTIAADFIDTAPPAPPILVESLQRNPAVSVGLILLVIAIIGLGIYWGLRRRRLPPAEIPDWYSTDDADFPGDDLPGI